jgi:hypothetical protein
MELRKPKRTSSAVDAPFLVVREGLRGVFHLYTKPPLVELVSMGRRWPEPTLPSVSQVLQGDGPLTLFRSWIASSKTKVCSRLRLLKGCISGGRLVVGVPRVRDGYVPSAARHNKPVSTMCMVSSLSLGGRCA